MLVNVSFAMPQKQYVKSNDFMFCKEVNPEQ